ncbi:MAG: energy-coupling factor ABC transporter ATP-binding protein [Coriobacteriales bacterium]|nr:energy-coupling factor ABC transporter ATP-binding protein [Coriobacteriales bacterium]
MSAATAIAAKAAPDGDAAAAASATPAVPDGDAATAPGGVAAVAPDGVAAAALELRDFRFCYRGADAAVLQDCSFRLEYGELVVLSGDSGAGKSTLLACLIGSIPHLMAGECAGQVLIDGIEVSSWRICERARLLGSVLQDADSQIVHSSVEDEIAFGCENRCIQPPEIEARISAACRWMALERNDNTRTLSGGQKQRLITAATLAMGQRIIVLDEPLANLDRAGAELLMGRLKALSGEGYAVLLVEHRLDHVLPYADRLVWMRDGRCQSQRPARPTEEEAQLPEEEAQLPEERTNEGIWLPQTRVREEARLPEARVGEASSPPSGLPAGRMAEPPSSSPEQPDGHQATAPALIELRDIAYTVHNREILSNISLSIARGERVVIVGENGCGKTTLLRILARLLRPSRGTLLRDGIVERRARPDARWFAEVGLVFQNPGYQLFMPRVQSEAEYNGASAEAARLILCEFGLAGLEERHPHSLSEGQKRALSIAVMLAREPRLLLLDEPTVGQDSAALERMVATLNRICSKRQMGLVTVTHDQRCAAALASRVLWLADGVIKREGESSLAVAYFSTD